MRHVMRALVYLALPFVAFAWLLQVDFPKTPSGLGDFGFYDAPSALDRLLEALAYVVLGAGIVVAVVAIVKFLRIGAPPPPPRR
jgi:hypothetical protein